MRNRIFWLSLVAISLVAGWPWYGKSKAADPEILAEQNRKHYFTASAQRPSFAATERAPCLHSNPLRNPYFGSLHIHTELSADAYAFGTRLGPDDAYAFARGATVWLPPLDESGRGTREITNSLPLDFAAVTDHAEYLGEHTLCMDSSSDAYRSLICRVYRGDLRLPVPDEMSALVRMASMVIHGKRRPVSVCGEDGRRCLDAMRSPWQEIQEAAERWYDRSESCEFTTFVAYEYSLAEKSSNLHRNVIFANATVPPLPLGAKEAPTPDILWHWLKDSCIDSDTGCDALAIPHNSNWSSGRMFYPEHLSAGSPSEQREAAQLRADIEPLVEILQVKGDSECRQGLWGVTGSPDEFCDFEKLRPPSEPVEDCRDEVGEGGMMLKGCLSRYAFARYALIQGLADEQTLGVNPFKFGLIADTDTHNATPGAVSERNWEGAHGTDASAQVRVSSETGVPGLASASTARYNPGGLAGVWAEENSREALFSAMRRRETFGTSGPRITPRFFAGWDIPADICDGDVVEQGYRLGVPMGGDLPPAETAGAPVFVAGALRDPTEDGAPLQRIQIIKGWVGDDGLMHQQIVDIAGGDNDASVNTATCERQGAGHAQLCGVWRDPDFDPDRPAVYYARVLENPSCRWTTWDCNKMPEQDRPAACHDASLPKTIQERAWTSPIWYTPEAASGAP